MVDAGFVVRPSRYINMDTVSDVDDVGVETLARPAPTVLSVRRADIQILRGVAVVLVILFHVDGVVRGGFIGVDMFFVISGFVITAGFLREKDSTSSIRLGDFYIRRVMRLLPALTTTLVVVLLATPILAPAGAQDETRSTAIGATLFASNFVLAGFDSSYFDSSSDLNPLLHTWSLSLEEQFYLAFPVALVVLLYVRTRTITVAALASLAVLSLFWSQRLLDQGQASAAFYHPFGRIWEFLAGCVLALIGTRRLAVAWKRTIALVASGVLLACALMLSETSPFPGLRALPIVLATAALIVVGGGFQPRAAPWRALGWIGDRSYSWYLWHWPCIVFFTAVLPQSRTSAWLGAILSLPIAAWTYRTVEQRFRTAHQSTVPHALSVVGSSIVLVLATAALTSIVSPILADASGYSDAVRSPADERLGCAHARTTAAHEPKCVIGTGEVTVFLIGDSTAGMYTDALADSADELGITLHLLTYYGCPIADLSVVRDGHTERPCQVHNQMIDDLTAADRPDLVILANATDIYPVRANITLRRGETHATDRAAKIALMERGMASFISRNERRDIDVLLIETIPKFEPFFLADCSHFTLLTRPGRCSPPTDQWEEQWLPAVAAERRAASTSGAATVDLTSALCPDDSCELHDAAGWWWKNGGHLSLVGSERTRDALIGKVEEMIEITSRTLTPVR